MNENFQKLLEEKLADKNLSAVAKKLNIPNSVLHDWINGGRSPSFKNLRHIEALSDYLGLSLDELLLGKNKRKTISSISFEDDGRKYQINIERIK